MSDPVLLAQSVLTSRDLLILSWLADHGVFTTPQLGGALFPSLDFAQRRLTRLVGLGLADRFRPLRYGGGSHPYHYVLDQLGAEVVAAQRDQPPPRPGHAKTNRRRWTAGRILAHRLGVNGFFTDLAAHARTHPDHQLQRWWSEARCARTGAFAGPGASVTLQAQPAPIHPDGHGTWTTGQRSASFFLEYDRGTEPLSALVRKLLGYAQLAADGGPPWPVLFWLPSTARERHLHQVLSGERLPVPVATAVHGRHPARGVWAVPGQAGGRRHLHDLVPHAD